MIHLERINGSQLWLNPLLIESIETTPDTVITLSNGHKYLVKQTADEVAADILACWSVVGLAGAVVKSSDEHEDGPTGKHEEVSQWRRR